jgi:hypothetical protein
LSAEALEKIGVGAARYWLVFPEQSVITAIGS